MDKVIYLTAVLRCDVHRAYELFTVNTLLESWLVDVAAVEPVIGGAYELFWEPDNRENNSTIGCKITALKQDELVAFEWKSPLQFKHFANSADPLTHCVVCFAAAGTATRVHLIHSGWRSTAEWEEARVWQEQAWGLAFKALEELVNNGG